MNAAVHQAGIQTGDGPILLDADTGVDDALAIALVLGAAPRRLIGVVASYGNVAQAQAERNTRDVLRLLGRPDIPVYAGSRAPSWADCFIPDAACAHFHGANGLGGLDVNDYLPHDLPYENEGRDAGQDEDRGTGRDARDRSHLSHVRHSHRAARLRDALRAASQPLPDPAPLVSADANARATRTTVVSYGGYLPALDAPAIPPNAAPAGDGGGVEAILDAAHRWGDALTLVTTGPLTDAAEAIRRDPRVAHGLRIVAMGGAFLQQGNCYDLTAETNIIQDPEAADFVLQSSADVTLVGLDATHRCLCTPAMSRAVREAGERELSARDAAMAGRAAFLADLMDVMIAANASVAPEFAHGAPLHDPLAMAAALDPTVLRTLDLPMKVQLATGDGAGVRGRTVGDPMGIAPGNALPPAHVAVDVDSHRFEGDFVASLCVATGGR